MHADTLPPAVVPEIVLVAAAVAIYLGGAFLAAPQAVALARRRRPSPLAAAALWRSAWRGRRRRTAPGRSAGLPTAAGSPWPSAAVLLLLAWRPLAAGGTRRVHRLAAAGHRRADAGRPWPATWCCCSSAWN